MKLFGMDFFEGTMQDIVQEVSSFAQTSNTHAVLVTPNVDHICKLETLQPEFVENYINCRWHLADGQPLVWTSKFFDSSLSQRLTGSDFVPAMLQQAEKDNLSVSLLLATEELVISFREYCSLHYPNLNLVTVLAAPPVFDPIDCNDIAIIFQENPCDILFVGLGFPKQEEFLFNAPFYKVGVGIGAAIEFLVGKKSRAPKWMQTVGLEFLHRAITDRRLIPRYVKNLAFLKIAVKEIRSNQSK